MSGARRVRDWQKTDPHLRRHPTFLKFKAHLGCSTTEANGVLAGLWAFAFDFAHNGDLTKYSPEELALAIEWEGDPDLLWEALSLGFVKNGLIHDWSDWGGALFTDRDIDAARKWDRRNAPKQELMSTDIHGQIGTKGDNAPDKIREEKIKRKSIVRQPQSDPLFDEFWTLYPRKEKKSGTLSLWNNLNGDRASVLTACREYSAWAARNKGAKLLLPTSFLSRIEPRWEDWVNGPPAGRDDDGKPLVDDGSDVWA